MFCCAALADSGGIDSRAETLLKRSTDYLAEQSEFTVEAQSTLEVVLTSGQKIQFDHVATLSIRRPDKLLAERHGELVEQIFYYNGKTLTLHNPSSQHYATLPAPDSIEKMLDFARDTLDVVAPAGDLLYRNAFEILTQEVTEGFIVGKSIVNGVRCDHLAFRAPNVDWQIWIQEGSSPLPCKFVITATDVLGAPQFSVSTADWNLAPDLSDLRFEFVPGSGAKKIEFLPAKSSYR
jgi:hypothetical protein